MSLARCGSRWRGGWHLVMDVLDRVPGMAAKAAYREQELFGKLVEHDHYVRSEGIDFPEVRDWSWSSPDVGVLH